jgi:hypothetical protein
MLLFMSVNSGCAINKKPKEVLPQRSFWGSKAECIEFLQNNPKAMSQRWLLEALGD